MSLQARVSDFMTPNPLTLSSTDSMVNARRLFLENRFTIAPVVNGDGKIIGVLSATDILKFEADAPELAGLVTEFMTRSIHCEVGSATVASAARVMGPANVHHLLVVDAEARPIGVLSGIDVAAAISDDDSLDQPIRVLMSEDLVQVDVGVTVQDARDTLEEHEVRAAAVMDNGELVGALSPLALLRALDDDPTQRVDQMMEASVRTVRFDTSIGDSARLFAEDGCRRLFITNADNEVSGIVTPSDLVRYAGGLAEINGM